MVYNNEDNQEKNIRGKALYFSTSQVANILNISDSKVRYYTNVFDDILHIEVSNKQRRYTEVDIDKMRFIIELKNEGMTIKQIQEYCQEVDFNDSKEIQVKENNPLSLQTIAKALLEQQEILINNMKQDIINDINNTLIDQDEKFNQMKIDLNKDVAITVEETINKRLQKSSNELENNINNRFNDIERKLEKKDINLVETLRETLKDDKIKALEFEIQELKSKEQSNQSFFGKLFHKKK